jgi:LacI family transcriptional regulator
MDKRPTINDVAQHAGVSKSTVSLVLRNSPLVKDETRTIVEASIKAINYVYNRSAARLRGAGTNLIGLIVNDLRNPFFTEFAISAQMTFSKHGYVTVIANTDENPETQKQVITSMMEHDVSAFLISPCYGGDDELFDTVLRTQIPLLQVMRCVDKRTDQLPFLSMDYSNGGRLAAEHLLSRGVRNIAFVGGVGDGPITQERIFGYNKIMKQHGLPITTFFGRATRQMGRETALDIVKHYPEIEAVICYNDLVALGMLAGFARTEKKVGHDILLVGFDDIDECREVFPQLSSIHCGITCFGKKSAEAIVNWLETGERPTSFERVPVTLVARQSSLGTGTNYS